MGATGVMITGGVYYGWEVVSRVAETLPWIGAAFCLLNDLVDIADAKFELEVQPLPVFLDTTLFHGLRVRYVCLSHGLCMSQLARHFKATKQRTQILGVHP